MLNKLLESLAVVNPGFPVGGANLVGAPTSDKPTFWKICMLK